ncbi:uncharacterized protein [Palaemon carinicauda]|uniref:uncharacterized protein n=1 Tax=Palaemon carinicauda TaxID=392227 RepID=UPI0035B6AA74
MGCGSTWDDVWETVWDIIDVGMRAGLVLNSAHAQRQGTVTVPLEKAPPVKNSPVWKVNKVEDCRALAELELQSSDCLQESKCLRPRESIMAIKITATGVTNQPGIM